MLCLRDVYILPMYVGDMFSAVQVYKAPVRPLDGANEGPWKPKKYTAINQVGRGRKDPVLILRI